ncbi:TPA: hypothetical protein RFU00_000333 [Klebsiella pneumoniae subsp. ozaenae]|nr:hypothetical protein [Klebsiella pneumoniae subsp. ozaenae]
MSTYKTKNPLGSAAVKDLYDNAENVDKFVNDRTKEELEDRLGVLRKTWHGMEMIFSRFIDYITGRGEQAVAAIGWQELGNWAVGLAVDNRQQIVYYNGSWYKYLGELQHVIAGDSPENDGGVWSAANPTGKWSNIGDAALRSNLGSGEGQLLVGSPRHLADLRGIFPGVSSRIKTLGAKWAYDGGAGEWWFDPSDMSELVSTYPRLFIAPTIDPSGASGAWRLNMGGDVTLSAFGVGISTELPAVMTALDAGIINPDIFLLENSGDMIVSDADYQFNADVLNQFNAYAKGKKYARLPTGKVFISELNFSYDPKFDLEWGVNSELASTRNLGSIDNGTVFIARDADSANPVITIAGTEAKRLSGIYMRNVAIVSKDLFDNRDLTIPAEWNVRSNRPALKLDYIASAIDIGTLTICGFKQALLGSELWDGSIRRLTVSICSDPDGTVPAVWLGSQHGDNSNALKFYDMRIEHCPFSLECGFIEHVRFINGKIETKRKKDATHDVVKINDTATRYIFDNMQFVTTPTTETPFLYDQGRWPKYSKCEFTIGGLTGFYPGVRWIYREPTKSSNAIFKAITITGPMAADGGDPKKYPMYLASYDAFDGSVICQDTYYIPDSEGKYQEFHPTNQGLFALGYQTKFGILHLNTNDISKVAGAIFYAREGEYNLGELSISGAPYKLLQGVSLGNIISLGALAKTVTTGDVVIYGKETIMMTAATTLTALTGFTGQTVRVVSFVDGSVIQNNARISTGTGADVPMVKNKFYTLTMLSNTTATKD